MSQNRPRIKTSPVRLIHIFTEGSTTEKEYIKAFRDYLDSNFLIRYKFTIKVHSSEGKSSPKNLQSRIIQTLNSSEAEYLTECWVLIDRDSWPNKQISDLISLGGKFKALSRYEVLISEPKFEIWLLYHFGDAKGVSTDRDVDREIKKHIPNYDKHVSSSAVCFENIDAVIALAKQKYDQNEHAKTSVYKLCEHLLALAQN